MASEARWARDAAYKRRERDSYHLRLFDIFPIPRVIPFNHVHALHSLPAHDNRCQNHRYRHTPVAQPSASRIICSTCPPHTGSQERRHPPRSSEHSHWPRRHDHVLTPYEPSLRVWPGGSHLSESCILSPRINRIASQPTSLCLLEIPTSQTPQ